MDAVTMTILWAGLVLSVYLLAREIRDAYREME